MQNPSNPQQMIVFLQSKFGMKQLELEAVVAQLQQKIVEIKVLEEKIKELESDDSIKPDKKIG